MQKRDIVTAIIFSIITCGIYGIYWFICLVNDVRTATKDESLPTGGTAFLLTIITCGIYALYLFFKLGKVMYEKNVASSDYSVLYLIASLFGFSIVNYCLIQSELNTFYEKNNVQ